MKLITKKLFYSSSITTIFSFTSKNSLIAKINKKFNTVPATSNAGAAPTQAPPVREKTKEEIKIENLMNQWPEFVRNPKPTELGLIEIKEKLIDFYQAHKGDKAAIYEWDIHGTFKTESYNIQSCLTADSIIRMLKWYNGFIDTLLVFQKFDQIATIKDITPEVFTVVIPILKYHMVQFDRHHIDELYYGVLGAAKMYLGDNEFWGIVEQKLVKEKLYKYLSLDKAANLAFYLSEAERGSPALIKALEVTFIKERKAVFAQKEIRKLVTKAYSKNGSDLLKAALKDPNIEVPAIDVKIPEMHLTPNHLRDINEKKLLH